MDLKLVKTFLEVANVRHFGKAAENLYLTQSTVSARIKALENELHTELFDRTTKAVTLTNEGEKFIKHAEGLMLAWNNAKFDLNSDYQQVENIAIGVTPGILFFFLNQKLLEVVESNKVFVNLVSQSSDDLAQYLYSNALDISIIYSMIAQKGIKAESLGAFNLRLIGREDAVLNFDWQTTPYVHVDWGENFNSFVARKLGDKPTRVSQTDNAQTAQYFIEHGDAVAYLPETVLDTVPGLVAVDEKEAPSFKRKIYACYSEDSEKLFVIKDLIKNIRF